jgi:hypothetical protein
MAFSPRINTLFNGLVFFLVITCKDGSQCVLLIGDGTLGLSILISLLLHAIMPMMSSIPYEPRNTNSLNPNVWTNSG